jgi:hypothetical protein
VRTQAALELVRRGVPARVQLRRWEGKACHGVITSCSRCTVTSLPANTVLMQQVPIRTRPHTLLLSSKYSLGPIAAVAGNR